MKCLIIAAGRGSRLRQRAESKPLVPLHGTPLIEHVIRTAREGGADEFLVVSGYQGELLRTHLDRVSDRDSISIRHVVNDRWREPNGLSVLQAKPILNNPFLLLMSDHLFDPSIVRDLLAQPIKEGEVILATDDDLGNPLVDLQDVTRVYRENGLIRDIGKGIACYNAYDTGIFYCTSALFSALDNSIRREGDASLSGGMRMLASRGRARCLDINGRFWLDIDDSRTYVKAEVAMDESKLVESRPVYSDTRSL